MTISARELFQREEELAAVYRTRKMDILFQSLRCPVCHTEGIRRRRFPDGSFASVDAVEAEMLSAIGERYMAPCAKCGHGWLAGNGTHHFLLLYSEQERAHLALSLRLSHEEDARTKVRRRLWLVPVGESGEELEDDDERLHFFWQESLLRSYLQRPDLSEIETELAGLMEDAKFRPVVLREYANILFERGESSDALTILEQSIADNPEQPDVLWDAGRLHSEYGNYRRATELLVEAWEQAQDVNVLPQALISAYRARKFGTAEFLANTLLERDTHAQAGARAIAGMGSAVDIDAWRFAWRQLEQIARSAGDRVTAQVAAYWCASLELPLPDWAPGASADEYLASIAVRAAGQGLRPWTKVPELRAGEAILTPDLAIDDADGTTHLIFVRDTLPTVACQRTLVAAFRAMRRDPDYAKARIVVLTQQIFPYSLYRYATDVSDVALELAVDADTTLDVHAENVATFLWAAERYFGALLDYSVGSLTEVDRILTRYYDHGFGALKLPLVCLTASYIREVLQRELGPCTWDDAEFPMDPRVLSLPDGGQANVLSRIERVVEQGLVASVHDFGTSLVEIVRGNVGDDTAS